MRLKTREIVIFKMELLRLTLTDSFKFNSINGFREIEMKLSVFVMDKQRNSTKR